MLHCFHLMLRVKLLIIVIVMVTNYWVQIDWSLDSFKKQWEWWAQPITITIASSTFKDQNEETLRKHSWKRRI